MTSSEIVYMLLEKKGWTQAKLSEALGYSSPGTMSNRLRRGSMQFKTLCEIAEVMAYEIVIRPIGEPGRQIEVAKLCDMDLGVKTLLDLLAVMGYEMMFVPTETPTLEFTVK